MRKRGGGNHKGGAFERKICKDLSLWVTGGDRKDVFWRTAMSGGRATLDVTVRQGGDVCAVEQEGYTLCSRCYFELKHYHNLDILAFFLGHKGKLNKFWERTRAEAAKHKKTPVLIARQDRVPTLVLVEVGSDFMRSSTARFLRLNRRWVRSFQHNCDVFLLDDVLSTRYDRVNSLHR